MSEISQLLGLICLHASPHDTASPFKWVISTNGFSSNLAWYTPLSHMILPVLLWKPSLAFHVFSLWPIATSLVVSAADKA